MPWPDSAYRYELFENPLAPYSGWQKRMPGRAGEVVGMVVVWLMVDEAHIATIAVHPDYRGQGIARSLLVCAARSHPERDAHATLEVRAGNLAAQSLYRRFRFEHAGVRPKYYRDNFEDALIMTVYGLDQKLPEMAEMGEGIPGNPMIRRKSNERR